MPAEKMGYIVLTLRYEREDAKWVGICEELGTTTFARTLRQCQSQLEELVAEHLTALDEVGEQDRFFERWHIQVHTASDRTTSLKAPIGHLKLLEPSAKPGNKPWSPVMTCSLIFRRSFQDQ